jgi:hypothetical protein
MRTVVLALWIGCLAPIGSSAMAERFPDGFTPAGTFDELVRTISFEPDIRVQINTPPAAAFQPGRPVRLIVYALPNGNTIEWTAGRRIAEGEDWHYEIQHIAAQTRFLRELDGDATIVVAYVEAAGRSWPTWRRKNDGGSEPIAAVVEALRGMFAAYDVSVELAAHSGGGSFLSGFINSADAIPDWVTRFVMLDSNYSYSDDEGHGDKLLAWLQRDPRHVLCVMAYDDRYVELNGKRIVSDTGGTFRATQRILNRFRQALCLAEDHLDVPPIGPIKGAETDVAASPPAARCQRWRALNGRCEFIIHENPQQRVLHTVMVELNGFLHAMTRATRKADRSPAVYTPRAYEAWIEAAP